MTKRQVDHGPQRQSQTDTVESGNRILLSRKLPHHTVCPADLKQFSEQASAKQLQEKRAFPIFLEEFLPNF